MSQMMRLASLRIFAQCTIAPRRCASCSKRISLDRDWPALDRVWRWRGYAPSKSSKCEIASRRAPTKRIRYFSVRPARFLLCRLFAGIALKFERAYLHGTRPSSPASTSAICNTRVAWSPMRRKRALDIQQAA